MDDEPPIACTLSVEPLRQRLQWLADLRQRALIRAAREGRRLDMLFSSDAAEEVDELVRRERRCCAFLTFETHMTPEGMRLTITAPETADSAADALLDYFAPDPPAAA